MPGVFEDYPWLKPAAAIAGAVAAGAGTAVGTVVFRDQPAPNGVATARLEKVETDLRALATWQAQHEGYSKTESERLRHGIEQALREIAEVREQLYRRGSGK